MRHRSTMLALAALMVCTAAPASPLNEVMDADRAFARHAVEHGAAAAFKAFAAPDAIFFRTGAGPVRGPEAIAAVFAGGTAVPQWAPEGGEVAASNDLAWTWGPYRWTVPGSTAAPLTGYYVTIWRRIDGRWRWVGDLGVTAPLPPDALR
ncbi:MAG: nuclear transport factor 2 family protein [Burkholderiaceae bacterium]|nr:nuclear transport factor 2 family protein [Burkholderiaceae bacterium]